MFKYHSGKLSLKRPSAKWFNYDCPEIYAPDGTLVLKGGFYGYEWDESESFISRADLAKFARSSYEAFCKKYNYEITPEWRKNDLLFNDELFKAWS